MKIEKNILNKPTNSFYGYDEPSEYPVSFIPHKSGTYRIEINKGIETVSQFSTAIQALDFAKEDDEIEIHLQCPGGSVDASGAFLHALRKCEAPIHIVATGGIHSAGTHILLEADSFELAENFNSLVHNGSAGSYGNINEYHSKSDFDKEFIRQQYKGIYEGFLTDEEFDGMMRGDNIWLDNKDWYERSMKRMEYFQKKHEAEQEATKEVEKPKRIKKPLTLAKEA